MLRYIIALLFLVACDQGWANPDHGDEAPGAPDCLSDPTLDFCEDHGDSDKHGPQGANTLHSLQPAQVGGHQSDWVDDQFGGYSVWWRWNAYNRINIYTNVTPPGQLPRTRTMRRINWSYCWGAQSATTWDTLPAGTAWLCTPGACVDVTNRHAPNSTSCRSGTLVDELPLTIAPGSYGHVEMWVTPQAGWIDNPQVGVSIGIGGFWYTDGL